MSAMYVLAHLYSNFHSRRERAQQTWHCMRSAGVQLGAQDTRWSGNIWSRAFFCPQTGRKNSFLYSTLPLKIQEEDSYIGLHERKSHCHPLQSKPSWRQNSVRLTETTNCHWLPTVNTSTIICPFNATMRNVSQNEAFVHLVDQLSLWIFICGPAFSCFRIFFFTIENHFCCRYCLIRATQLDTMFLHRSNFIQRHFFQPKIAAGCGEKGLETCCCPSLQFWWKRNSSGTHLDFQMGDLHRIWRKTKLKKLVHFLFGLSMWGAEKLSVECTCCCKCGTGNFEDSGWNHRSSCPSSSFSFCPFFSFRLFYFVLNCVL